MYVYVQNQNSIKLRLFIFYVRALMRVSFICQRCGFFYIYQLSSLLLFCGWSERPAIFNTETRWLSSSCCSRGIVHLYSHFNRYRSSQMKWEEQNGWPPRKQATMTGRRHICYAFALNWWKLNCNFEMNSFWYLYISLSWCRYALWMYFNLTYRELDLSFGCVSLRFFFYF